MDLKKQIDKDYSNIVSLNENEGGVAQRESVCGPIFEPIKYKYPSFKGYVEQSDLGLGCGFPFLYADIKKGYTVLDLGCAAGVDSFIVREMVGEEGKVIGFDLTERLVARANRIVAEKGFKNITFQQADIEKIPLEDESADCIITNGVFSLLPNLDKAFAEVFRTLKSGGTFCMADINKRASFSETSYNKVKNFTGCLNGIRFKHRYLERMINAGFKQISILDERIVELPKDIIGTNGNNNLYITTFKTGK